MTDIVRVLRILEYVGERRYIEHTLATGAVPATGEYMAGSICIRSAVIGQYPEVLETRPAPARDHAEDNPNHGG